MRVSAGSGAHVALIGEDVQAATTGLAGNEGLGSGLTYQMVNFNLIKPFNL